MPRNFAFCAGLNVFEGKVTNACELLRFVWDIPIVGFALGSWPYLGKWPRRSVDQPSLFFLT